MKKYNFVYHTKILNLKTGVVKHYFGKHKTNNLNDHYCGSGYYIRHIKNYPDRYKVSVKIVEMFSTYELASNAEVLYIKSGKIKYGSLCMNLSSGGQGGTVYVSTRVKNSNHAKRLWASKEHRIKVSKSLKETFARADVRERMSIAQMISQSRPEVKALQSKNTKLALAKPDTKKRHVDGIRKAKRSHLTNWNYFDELFVIWKENGKTGWRKFTKLVVSLGYPNEPYNSMIQEFKRKI